jgi:hypothetical protein
MLVVNVITEVVPAAYASMYSTVIAEVTHGDIHFISFHQVN